MWTLAIWLLCPRDSPGENTWVGSHSLLQGIFSTPGLNLGLLHCRQILYHLRHQRIGNQAFTKILLISSYNHRVHFYFFPFLCLQLPSPTIRNLTPIILNNLTDLMNSFVCDTSPIMAAAPTVCRNLPHPALTWTSRPNRSAHDSLLTLLTLRCLCRCSLLHTHTFPIQGSDHQTALPSLLPGRDVSDTLHQSIHPSHGHFHSARTPGCPVGPLWLHDPHGTETYLLGFWTDCFFRKEKEKKGRGRRKFSKSFLADSGPPVISPVTSAGIPTNKDIATITYHHYTHKTKNNYGTYWNFPDYLKDILFIVSLLEPELINDLDHAFHFVSYGSHSLQLSFCLFLHLDLFEELDICLWNVLHYDLGPCFLVALFNLFLASCIFYELVDIEIFKNSFIGI